MSAFNFYGLLVLTTGRTASPAILPELHLNLWERGDAPWSFTAFLDIGLMIDVNDTAQTFEFALPWEVKKDDLEDLSLKVLEQNAVPAIFNEIWSSTVSNGRAGCVTISNSESFTVVEPNSDLLVHEYNPGTNNRLVTIRLKIPGLVNKSKSTFPAAQRLYVRFRIKNVPHSFYQVDISPKDRILLSSWQNTEIIDFRMNVRRGVPLSFDTNLGGEFAEFSKVHLFLMKSRDRDIVFEDKLFRACRSLEDEHFWAGYSLSGKWANLLSFWSRHHVKNSLGYQWTKTAHKDSAGGVVPVREFSTLARFKKVRFGLLSFIIAALFVGAGGNAIWEGGKLKFGNTAFAKWVEQTVKPTSSDDKK